MPHSGSRLTVATAAILLLFGCAGGAGTPPSTSTTLTTPAASTLRFVLLVSRHGVRAPLGSNARIAEFAAQTWPTWSVQAGFLTPHGGDAVQLMGAYYASFYRRMGCSPRIVRCRKRISTRIPINARSLPASGSRKE